MRLSLTEARALADRALGAARERGHRISVVVVDEYGLILQLDRMDDAPLISPDVAEAKALTALSFQRPTSELAADFGATPGRQATLGAVVRFPIVATPGGIPIVRDGAVIGAIAVSGGSPADDEAVARAALAR